MPIVTRVRRVRAPAGGHDHVAGVCTPEGVYFSRYDLLAAIDAGEEWWTERDGVRARIRTTPTCPFPGCATRYMTTDPDEGPSNALEELPDC